MTSDDSTKKASDQCEPSSTSLDEKPELELDGSGRYVRRPGRGHHAHLVAGPVEIPALGQFVDAKQSR